MPVQTSGHFTYADWEERTVSPGEAHPKLAHASVTNSFSGGISAAGTTCEYTIVYGTEKTGTFTGMEVLTGSLDGREGTFVVEERGSFDADGTVHCTFEVVPGTATGELAGLRGTGGFTAVHGARSVPYTFAYVLD
ncbi:DUF3224 domain-containing protein [Streptomyces sp. Ru73]|uniref:DUF3224 domain-containing protein n=1 Tax=Streptomyces sp. Ru73 TaxID=2080748 RepID=UPI000CDE33B7|nr:DUF3224 domain-containing protein [Streptomyces sp. Ru73]POX40630.1 DUF3224 domain-containing protein [Streptomyces sp. Ru73]